MVAYPDTLEISVTQEHIDRGKLSSLDCCPIALAIKDMYAEKLCVSERWFIVGMIPIGGEMVRYHYEFKQHGKDFVDRFDLGMSVEPGKFTAQLS